MSNMIECGTCGYPLTPEERTSLVEHNGRMVKLWQSLTDEEINAEATSEEQAHGFIQGALWAESKLKEKNA